MKPEPCGRHRSPRAHPQWSPPPGWDSAADCRALAAASLAAGDFERAESFFRRAVALSPHDAHAHFDLGRLYQDRGHLEEARVCYEHAAELDTGCAAAHYNLGLTFMATGRFAAAAASFQRAIAAEPREPAAVNNLGIALQELGRGAEALACFERAGRMDPGYAEAHCNAGRMRFQQERWEDAIRFFGRAVSARPDYAEAWHNLGLCFHKQRDLEQARSCYERVLALNPSHHAAHLDQGNICLDRGDLQGMADWYRKALTHTALDAAACTNVGRMFQGLGRQAEALECFEAALKADPGLADAHFQRAVVLLTLGRWTEGWAEYEWRLRRADWRNGYPHRLPAPRWDGRRFAGKTLLVHCEQGFGDAIQFVRYLPLVKARGGTVLLEAPAPLARLFRGVDGVDDLLEFSPERTTNRKFDFQTPLLSLPGVFQTTPEDIPADLPYLGTDPGMIAAWAMRLAAEGLKVGVVWAASGWTRALAGKSCRLADFMTLATVPGVALYGLQKGEAAREARQVPGGAAFANLGDEFTDFAETAAAVASLDLVISVDTAVAHLAGAMGRPVWVLLPFHADWRWMEGRESSPWYPTMRLFRQQAEGGWAGVFERVRRELRRLAGLFEAPCSKRPEVSDHKE